MRCPVRERCTTEQRPWGSAQRASESASPWRCAGAWVAAQRAKRKQGVGGRAGHCQHLGERIPFTDSVIVLDGCILAHPTHARSPSWLKIVPPAGSASQSPGTGAPLMWQGCVLSYDFPSSPGPVALGTENKIIFIPSPRWRWFPFGLYCYLILRTCGMNANAFYFLRKKTCPEVEVWHERVRSSVLSYLECYYFLNNVSGLYEKVAGGGGHLMKTNDDNHIIVNGCLLNPYSSPGFSFHTDRSATEHDEVVTEYCSAPSRVTLLLRHLHVRATLRAPTRAPCQMLSSESSAAKPPGNTVPLKTAFLTERTQTFSPFL